MRYQSGFNIVELMVASLLSLVLLSGVIQIFQSSRATYHQLEGQSAVLENGRFAMHVLTDNIRMAGLQNTDPTRTLRPDGSALFPAIHPFMTVENGTFPDTIAIYYDHPKQQDCTGQMVAQPSLNAFQVAINPATGVPGLYCNGMLIVDGVSNMQILYGEDMNDTGSADRWVPFNLVTPLSSTVRAVRIQITVDDPREEVGTAKVKSKTFTSTILLRNNQG